MGIRTRLGVEGEAYHRAVANVLEALKRATAERLSVFQDGISVGMFDSYSLPYEASKTYRTIMTEFRCRRAQTQLHAQRASLGRL